MPESRRNPSERPETDSHRGRLHCQNEESWCRRNLSVTCYQEVQHPSRFRCRTRRTWYWKVVQSQTHNPADSRRRHFSVVVWGEDTDGAFVILPMHLTRCLHRVPHPLNNAIGLGGTKWLFPNGLVSLIAGRHGWLRRTESKISTRSTETVVLPTHITVVSDLGYHGYILIFMLVSP